MIKSRISQVAILFKQAHDDGRKVGRNGGIPTLRRWSGMLNGIEVDVPSWQVLIPKGMLTGEALIHADAKSKKVGTKIEVPFVRL